MEGIKSNKYKNYGSIPQNEYGTNNTEKNTGSAATLRYDSRSDDTAYKQRLMKRQAQHPSGRRKIRGLVALMESKRLAGRLGLAAG